jgi:rhamnose transport system substrate-binding protein
VAAALIAPLAAAQDKVRIALVPKALGIGFFEAAERGAQQAAEELGDVEIIYTGPTDTTAEGQIETVNALIAQQVDAIAISANDPDALVPALKRAMDRGIVVVSWDSGVAPEGRMAHLHPSSNRAHRRDERQARRRRDAGGQDQSGDPVRERRPTPTRTPGSPRWRRCVGNYDNVDIVTTVYGDDLSDKSYRETQALLQNASRSRRRSSHRPRSASSPRRRR